MEAGSVPRAAPTGVSATSSWRLLRVASDAHLVALVRERKAVAFEVIYDRHHRAILSFCRHMLGSREEAEDALQHTFLAAYNDLTTSTKPIQLRAWLFTIARNRCYSILRARREQPLGELDEPATEGLATQVQRRQDLRDLVGDLRKLPDDQRAALVLSEMDSLSHDQIAAVLGVPKDKVKALVFQARESLVASRQARETDCAEIREQLANLHGGALRRANLRRHLRDCAGCREFRHEVDRQRRQLRIVLPVAPTLALKEAVLAATVGGGATATITTGGGGAIAGSLVKGGALKSLIGAALAGVGTAGTIVAVHDFQTAAQPAFGPHQLTARAPFTPAPATADRATAARATPSAYSSTDPAATVVATPYAPSTAAVTAILNPLSRHGVSSAKVRNPLVLADPRPTRIRTVPVVSRPHGRRDTGSPNLSPSAFGQGDQGASGGSRSLAATGERSEPSDQASGAGGGWQSQASSGSSSGGWKSHAVSGGGSGGRGSTGGGGTGGGGQGGSGSTGSGSTGSGSTGGSPGGGDQGGGRTSQSPSQGSGGGSGGGQSTGGGSGSGAGPSGESGGSGGDTGGSRGGGQGGSGSSVAGSGSSSGTGSSGSAGQGGVGQGGGQGYGGGSNAGPQGR